MILNELVFNIELGHPKSVFFYRKSSEAPLEWGPVWDFDWAFGYAGANFVYFQNPDQLMFDITHQSGQMWGAGGTFFSRFLLMPEFCELYRQEWEKVLPEVSDIGGGINGLRGNIWTILGMKTGSVGGHLMLRSKIHIW